MALLQGQERFYVGSEFRPTVSYLLGDFSHFAPWYTIACIVIFAAFRLYGGMWRYAGMNDIILAIPMAVIAILNPYLSPFLFFEFISYLIQMI